MKKLIIKGLQLSLIIALVSCAYRGNHLVNLDSRELASETELILTTSDPVKYKHTKSENPPCLVINFLKDVIFSFGEDELIINKGAVKKIKYEYDLNTGKGQSRLNQVRVELVEDLPYKIFQSGSSIIIRIKNPAQSKATLSREKIRIETQKQQKEEALKLELGYLIGPGDILNIEVWKQPDITRDVTVNYLGEIRLPPIKKLNAMGLTIPELEDKLTETLSKYLIDPIVFVIVKEYNSQRVIALGETNTGMYTLKRRTTLVEFLGEIGGTTDNADIFNIKLIKKDGKTLTYDLNELISTPQKGDEVVVSGGDTVYVPPLEFNKIYVLGEVRTPKIINLRGKMTVVDAIADAGGYTPDAVTGSIMVIRGEIGSQKGIRINLKRILKEGDVGQNIDLKAGDIVYVPKSFIVDVERFIRDISTSALFWIWTGAFR